MFKFDDQFERLLLDKLLSIKQYESEHKFTSFNFNVICKFSITKYNC